MPLTTLLFRGQLYTVIILKTSVKLLSKVQFSHSVVSNSLRPHEPQHTRPHCPTLTPGVYSNSCPSHWWCHQPYDPLLAPSLPTFNLFQHQGLFQWVDCIGWPDYWSFSFSISPSSEYSGLISFRIDWFDLLAVQGTFRSLLQHYNLKASILWHLAFFMVQLSHLHMTAVKTTCCYSSLFLFLFS